MLWSRLPPHPLLLLSYLRQPPVLQEQRLPVVLLFIGVDLTRMPTNGHGYESSIGAQETHTRLHHWGQWCPPPPPPGAINSFPESGWRKVFNIRKCACLYLTYWVSYQRLWNLVECVLLDLRWPCDFHHLLFWQHYWLVCVVPILPHRYNPL